MRLWCLGRLVNFTIEYILESGFILVDSSTSFQACFVIRDHLYLFYFNNWFLIVVTLSISIPRLIPQVRPSKIILPFLWLLLAILLMLCKSLMVTVITLRTKEVLIMFLQRFWIIKSIFINSGFVKFIIVFFIKTSCLPLILVIRISSLALKGF